MTANIIQEKVSMEIGKNVWAIAEGYIPPASTGEGRQMVSHETVCILNATDAIAEVAITVYFADRDPAGPYLFNVPGRRTRHIRFNELEDPEVIPIDTDFASVIASNVPVVVQHTRLDSRQEALALLSTMAYPST
jgi:hypothetical protein